MVGEKYIEAVAAGAHALPVLVPALGPELDLAALLEACDGLLLTGSASNVEPHHYGGPASAPGTLHDPNRDATTLPLIPRAVAAGCAGARDLPRIPGNECRLWRHLAPARCTRSTDTPTIARTNRRPLEVQYGPAHEVLLEPGGTAAEASPARIACRSTRCTGRESRRSARGLAVEARAPDGVIEAFRCRGGAGASRSACSGTRSGNLSANPFSRALFAAFRRRQPAARSRSKVIHGQHDSAIFEGTRHLGGRGDHPRHGGRRARQAHAGGEIRRGGGHAPAGGDLPADGHRRLPGRPERDESVGHRHRAARRTRRPCAWCRGRPSRPRR